jgi:phosphinothricin acetyltransferase
MAIHVMEMEPDDWNEVRAIYLEGIATGQATFETTAPSWDVWDKAHLQSPRLVAFSTRVLGWAALSHVSSRAAYFGVAEVSVYVTEAARGQGLGRMLLQALIEASEQLGIWTLQASIFPENVASISLHKKCGFREVGTRRRVAKLNGAWRDTVLLERRSETSGND